MYISRAVNGPENRKTVPCVSLSARSIVNLELFHTSVLVVGIVSSLRNSGDRMDCQTRNPIKENTEWAFG